LNNWIKIGVPVLVVLLLIVTAVSITLAATRDNSPRQLAVSTYKADAGPTAPGALCPNCPGYGDADDNPADTGLTAGAQVPSCHVINSQNSYSPTVRGGCCGAR
jgi:hypothetical protein